MPAAVAFDVVSCPAKSVLRKIQQSWSRLNISSLPGSCQARTRSPMRFSPGSATRRSTCSFAKFQYSPIAVASSTCSSSEGTPQPIVASRAVPVLILSTSYSGHAHEREGDLRRGVPDEVGDDVGLAAVDDPVDRLVDELAAARLERGDALGREGAAEDLPVTRVLGRVEVDERRPRVDAVLAHDLQRRGARRLDLHEGVRRGVRLGVVQHRHDVVPPRHDPVVEDRAVEDRLLRARTQHERVPRGGVARERVELAAEPGDRAVSRAHPRNLRPGVTARLACPLTRP